MRETHVLFAVALTLASPTSVLAAEPLQLALEPRFFTFSTEPGTLRTSVRWGEISVRGHDGYEVLVSARVTADRDRSAGAKRIEDLVDIRIEERDNIMDLYVDTRQGGFYGVELDLVVPRETRLELEMSDGGEISVGNVLGEVDIVNRNGSVELSGLGAAAVVDARNGSITASFDRVDPELPMSFSTLNGSVDVTFPGDTAASVRIRHTYGGVESDFPLVSVSGEKLEADLDGLERGETRVLSAEINGGGPRFDFYTANGTVYLRRRAPG